MIRTELTLRLPNSPGALAGICRLLSNEHVNIVALSLEPGGRLHLIVDNPVRASGALMARASSGDRAGRAARGCRQSPGRHRAGVVAGFRCRRQCELRLRRGGRGERVGRDCASAWTMRCARARRWELRTMLRLSASCRFFDVPSRTQNRHQARRTKHLAPFVLLTPLPEFFLAFLRLRLFVQPVAWPRQPIRPVVVADRRRHVDAIAPAEDILHGQQQQVRSRAEQAFRAARRGRSE